ncbi:preprotein translocase subunit SecG [Candidatus Uhrbacteria bacterium]|nr:preprotein translocase subunit SecG [Candidatus Uhrbacteria bacterium]
MAYVSAIQLVSAVFLTIAILLQARGTGLSGAFGGEGNIYRTKRGVEKMLFIATIIFAIIFFGSAVLALALR